MSLCPLSSLSIHTGQAKPFSPSSPHCVRRSLTDDVRCLERLAQPNQGHPHLRMAYLLNIVRRPYSCNRSFLVDTWLEIIEGGAPYQDLWLWDEGDEEWLDKNVLEEGDYDPPVTECPIATLYPPAFQHAVSLLRPEDWNRAHGALQRRLKRSSAYHTHLPDSPFVRMNVLAWLVLTSPLVTTTNQPITGGRDGDRVVQWHLSARNLFRPSLPVAIWIETLHPFFRSHDHTCLHHLRLESDWLNLNDWVWTMCRLYSADDIKAFVRGVNSCDVCAARFGQLAQQCRSQPIHRRFLNDSSHQITSVTCSIPSIPKQLLLEGTGHTGPIRNSSTLGLAGFQAMFCPFQYPVQWLEANRRDIITIIQACENLTEAEKTECVRLTCDISVYQRFLVHTYVGLKSCAHGESQMDSFLKALEAWRSWDARTSLVNHQSIRDLLSAYTHTYKNVPVHCPLDSKEAQLASLYSLDIFALYAQVLVEIGDATRLRALLSLHGGEAQSMLNLLQLLVDYPCGGPHLKGPFVSVLIKLSNFSGLYPHCLAMRGVQKTGQHPLASGRYGEVWAGLIRGQRVAIKVIRLFNRSNTTQWLKNFSHEAVIWSQLHHPNLLPLYGVYRWGDDPQTRCLISPWMTNGTVMDYLHEHPDADRRNLIFDVIQGLEHLHGMTPCIIHGDLKGINILVSPSGRACLADFGLAALGDSFMSLSVSSSGQRIGTIPYTAPEMLNPADKADTRMTRESDMYGFAGVCYEILTGNVPFHDSPNYANVIWRVVHIGEIPERPADEVCVLRGLTDEMWSITTTCWSRDKTIRLTASEAAKRIHDLPDRPMDTRPAGNWDSAATSQLRSSITDHPFAPSVQHIEAALRSCDPEDTVFVPAQFSIEAGHYHTPGTDAFCYGETSDSGRFFDSCAEVGTPPGHTAVCGPPHPPSRYSHPG